MVSRYNARPIASKCGGRIFVTIGKFAQQALCGDSVGGMFFSVCFVARRDGQGFLGGKKPLKEPPGLRELKADVPPSIEHLHDHYAPDPNFPGIFAVHPRACDPCRARFLRADENVARHPASRIPPYLDMGGPGGLCRTAAMG